MTLRISLSIVPFGIEENVYQIGKIDISNLGQNADGKYDYAVVQIKHVPFGDALASADAKGLVRYQNGYVTGVKNQDHEDVKTVQVHGHDRSVHDAYDLLYRALIALGYRDRNPDT